VLALWSEGRRTTCGQTVYFRSPLHTRVGPAGL